MAKPASDVVKYPWLVRLHFADGHTEDVSVEANTISEMVFSLPYFKDVGKYRYEILKHGHERRA